MLFCGEEILEIALLGDWALFGDEIVEMLFLGEDNLENPLRGDEIVEMLLLGEAILERERLRAILSDSFLVCEGALLGIWGASSSEADAPK
jgi:hypothetical protein